MFEVHLAGSKINLGLIVVDMQNGFVAKAGSYDKLGMNTPSYREIIPKVKDLIDFCKSLGIPVFYTEAVRESSGIDLLTKIHTLLPKSKLHMKRTLLVWLPVTRRLKLRERSFYTLKKTK